MISSPLASIQLATARPSFARKILDVTLIYLLWGYGALLLSCVAYSYYAAFQRTIPGSAWLSISLAAIATACTLAIIAFLRSRKTGQPSYRHPHPTPGSPEQHSAPHSR
jgi:hypothetical protein